MRPGQPHADASHNLDQPMKGELTPLSQLVVPGASLYGLQACVGLTSIITAVCMAGRGVLDDQ